MTAASFASAMPRPSASAEPRLHSPSLGAPEDSRVASSTTLRDLTRVTTSSLFASAASSAALPLLHGRASPSLAEEADEADEAAASFASAPGLRVEDAVAYVEQIRARVASPVYQEALAIMLSLTTHGVDIGEAMRRLAALLVEHDGLCLGLNDFLPLGYRFEHPEDGGAVFFREPGGRVHNVAPVAVDAQPQRLLPQQRRGMIHDRLFRRVQIKGLTSREFEVDLLLGERIIGEPIRVRLRKTMSQCHRILRTVLTLGLYEVWHRCCATGSEIFDVDARLAFTTRGRLLLWTHSAGGGSVPLLQHCLRAAKRPITFVILFVLVIFFAVGPVALGIDLVPTASAIALVVLAAILSVFWNWLLGRASLVARTSVRQFDVRELSCVRLLCYSRRSLFGLGGETTSCNVHLFFGRYPREGDLRATLNAGGFDSGSVVPTVAVAEGEQDRGSPKIQQMAGVGTSGFEGAGGFLATASAGLIILAFAAFANEMTDFLIQLVECISVASPLTADVVSICISAKFRDWWTGEQGASKQTIISHWIDVTDWSLQLLLFFYVIGPASAFIWSALYNEAGAGIGFIVDRRRGTATEDERFEEHWEELNAFVSELFARACGDTPAEVAKLLRRSVGGGDATTSWDEVDGDITDGAGSRPASSSTSAHPTRPTSSPGGEGGAGVRMPRSSWRQVEELTSRLIDPLSGRVRVYRGVLAWLDGEHVVAAYPERVVMGIVTKVKIVLTCGLEYFCRWRMQRRDGAIILTDRRLIQVSAHSSKRTRSLKVDMFTVGASVKYLGLRPPARRCCQSPAGELAVTTRCGVLRISLARMTRLTDNARALWQGFSLLQECTPLRVAELSDYATIEPSDEEEDRDAALQGDAPPHNQASSIYDGEATAEACLHASAIWESAATAGGDSVGAVLERSRDDAVLQLSAAGGHRIESWGVPLSGGERVLWGPVLFETEVHMRCRCHRFVGHRPGERRQRPSALVVITDRRLIVLQFGDRGCLACRGLCYRVFVKSVVVVPLKCVLGFSIQESLSVQQALLTRFLGWLCCFPPAESWLLVRILTNAGLGKIYLSSLEIAQRVLPVDTEPQCTFEEEKVLQLRRWLGNLALFFAEYDVDAANSSVELCRCAYGLAPA